MKRALTVGINYVGTGSDLRGCITDSENMKALLESRGFEVRSIHEKEATTEGIKSGLGWLVSGAKPGDVIVFHYSGHGSQLPSKVEEDGFEEIICPIDLNWRDKVITDDTLRQIFDTVPDGVNVTLFLDCCHSGTMLDQKESTVSETRSSTDAPVATARKIRKRKGDRFLKPPAAILKKLKDRELVEWSATKDVNKTAMLIAACREEQTAADAKIDGIFQGAATAALLRAVKENPDIEYKQIIVKMNDYMTANRFTQRPVLDGSFGLHKEKFLEPWSMFTLPPVADVVFDPEFIDIPEGSITPKVLFIGGVILAMLALVLFA